jgi:2-methylisocitrate lyase-like PEP mutase family enzyme
LRNGGDGPSRLNALFRRPGLIKSLGAHDVLSALIVQQAGFETIFVGGFGASASVLGLPDLNFLTLTEMAGAVRRMASRVRIPIVADGDTGHGSVHNVMRTVQEFEAAGAAGVILEDQVSPKRCGHFEGKEIIPREEMGAKLKAAVKARGNPRFVIIARTDARDVTGLDDAIRRVNFYAACGADCVFIESPHTLEELKIIPRRVKAPMLVNMLTGGKTPNPPVNSLERMGYKIAVYPIESLLVCAKAVRALADTLLKTGSVEKVKKQMVTFGEMKEILGLSSFLKLRKKLVMGCHSEEVEGRRRI